jgi:hypothetical protein
MEPLPNLLVVAVVMVEQVELLLVMQICPPEVVEVDLMQLVRELVLMLVLEHLVLLYFDIK